MIKISGINKTYDTGNRALRNVNITTRDGEFVLIVDRSNSSKSTLLRLPLKEARPSSGKIIVNDMHLDKMPRRYMPRYRKKLSMVFQDSRLLEDKDVHENVALALRIIDAPTRAIEELVSAMFRMVGLSSKYKSFPQQLPSEKQQRTAIARALISDPEVLLMDEPTGNPNDHNAIEIMKLLEEINQQGTTVTVVTHSRGIVGRIQRRAITMDRGVVVSGEKKGGYAHEDQYILILSETGHY